MNTIAKNSKYSNMLFCDYMLEWLANIKPKVVQSTYIGYEQVVKGRLYPYFKTNKLKLVDLRPRDIQDFINYLYKQNLKGSTITHYTSNMNTALKEAVIAEIIQSNPMDRIESVKKEEEDKAFYSGSYKFSKKDFFDDDFQETKKGSSFAKALIIIVVLSICITGIYFLIDFLGSR